MILRDETYIIDRSLNSTKFKKATGYIPTKWYKAIQEMKEFSKLNFQK